MGIHKKFNLLYVITQLELGGAQKQLLALIRQADTAQFRIFLFTAAEGLLMPDALSIPELTVEKSRWLGRRISPLRDCLSLIELFRFIKKNNIEIVHTHSSKAGIIGRIAAGLAKTKVILHTVHGWSFHDYQHPLARWFFIRLERLAARCSDKIIVVSQHDMHKGLRHRIGRESQYALIRYGIDTAEFSVDNKGVKQEFGIDSHEVVVTMVACFKPQKNPLDFVRLAEETKERFPRVKFILVGDGVLRSAIEGLLLRRGVQHRIMLTGWRRDIPRILSITDVFVLTSLWEGLPISVLEAMASGTPVIATHTGGVAEAVVDGKNGFLVPPKDMNTILNRLDTLLGSTDLRMKMSNNAAASFDSHFSLSRMVKDSQDLYRFLNQEKGPADA